MESVLKTVWAEETAGRVMARAAVLCGVKRTTRAMMMPRIKNAMRTGASRLRRAGWEKVRSGTGIRVAIGDYIQKILAKAKFIQLVSSMVCLLRRLYR